MHGRPDPTAPLDFLSGGGCLGALIRAHDWAATPLGPPHTWSQVLKTLVSVMLGSSQPMFIAWGPERILLYNDAYSEILAQKHPAALGQPFLDVWDEIRDDLIPIVEQAYAGEPVHMDDITLFMMRRGFREETHFAFSYTPIRDETGAVAGFLCPCIETTAQVMAERRQAAEKERQQRLFEQAPGFITVLTGPNHVFEFVNQAYVRLFGDRDYVGRTVRDVFPELEGQGFFEWLDQVYETGQRFVANHLPVRLQASPGAPAKHLVLDFIYEPVIDEAGIIGIFCEGHDVTETHIAQQALAREKERLEILNRIGSQLASELDLDTLVQAATDAGVALTGAQFGAFFYNVVNQQGESYMLYSLSGVAREAFSRFPMPSNTAVFHPTFAGEGVVRSDDILKDPRYGKNDPYYGMPKGHLPVRSYLAVPVISRSGEVLGGLFFGHERPSVFTQEHENLLTGIAGQAAIAIDNARLFRASQHEIGERRRAEEALRDLNHTLETRVAERTAERDRVWKNSRDLLVVVDADGIFRAVNPAWTEILGHAPDEVVGHSFLDFIWPEDAALTQSGLDDAVSSRDLTNFENRYTHKDGTPRWISWHTSAEGDLVYAYGRDVTAAKEQEEALRQTEEALRQAQKMEAVGQLTGGIAHDFNNLLTGIVGSLDLMQTRIAQGRTEAVERYAKAAMSSAQRAAGLTHRLLAFARRQPLAPRTVDTNKLVVSMEDLLRRTLGEAVQMEFVTAGGLWLTRCDPHQLESAILNLAINARDAMPDGGRLTIETCNTHLDHAYTALHPGVRPGQYVCVAVTDTGTGMPPEVIERAFDPFFTTKPLGQGTGLGLSMIYGFAQQSEGHARIYSEVGQGTTVKIYLPRFNGAVEEEAETAGLADAPRSETGETVLVVEDEPVVRDLIVDVLKDLGYRALEAVDGPSGLRMLQSSRRIDLLVTDVGLPGMNGRQLADQAREHRPDLKVLFITGYAENAAVASGFLEQGMEMITKPFAVEALAIRIREMIER
ncbi:PAS domain-containing protein [Microvirga lenta]|uniref:PAS domain-containing protein n=1 Tax=Microvirga lenta TaxID=2881337 RepID=UPI001CFFB5BC|nr:PAS domain-containing protein [Microvirga lenta]MCB5176927.1 PAS domain-containing protein [Microvirga lenta]